MPRVPRTRNPRLVRITRSGVTDSKAVSDLATANGAIGTAERSGQIGEKRDEADGSGDRDQAQGEEAAVAQ